MSDRFSAKVKELVKYADDKQDWDEESNEQNPELQDFELPKFNKLAAKV